MPFRSGARAPGAGIGELSLGTTASPRMPPGHGASLYRMRPKASVHLKTLPCAPQTPAAATVIDKRHRSVVFASANRRRRDDTRRPFPLFVGMRQSPVRSDPGRDCSHCRACNPAARCTGREPTSAAASWRADVGPTSTRFSAHGRIRGSADPAIVPACFLRDRPAASAPDRARGIPSSFAASQRRRKRSRHARRGQRACRRGTSCTGRQ
jgi:hypothetical protein